VLRRIRLINEDEGTYVQMRLTVSVITDDGESARPARGGDDLGHRLEKSADGSGDPGKNAASPLAWEALPPAVEIKTKKLWATGNGCPQLLNPRNKERLVWTSRAGAGSRTRMRRRRRAAGHRRSRLAAVSTGITALITARIATRIAAMISGSLCRRSAHGRRWGRSTMHRARQSGRTRRVAVGRHGRRGCAEVHMLVRRAVRLSGL